MGDSFSLRAVIDPLMWPWTALVLGLLVGSFANVCVYRLPRRKSLMRPRSSCPSCGTPIHAWDNVPVLSYLWLGGRCRTCRARIPLRYPLVEAANGVLYLLVALRMPPGLRAVLTMAFLTALLVLSLIDLEWQILPDAITLPGTAVALAASLVPGPPAPLESALAALGGYLGFALVAALGRRVYRREALGMGDWKMAALLGAFLGWRSLLFTVFFACLAGSIVGLTLIAMGRGSRLSEIPLGTFLGVAGMAAVFLADPVVTWYGQFLDA